MRTSLIQASDLKNKKEDEWRMKINSICKI